MANVKRNVWLNIWTIYFIINASNSAVERPLKICSIKDDICLNDLFKGLLVHLSEHGGHDVGIPRIDPMEIKNLSVTFFDTISLLLTEGVIEGLGKCDYEKNHADLDIPAAKQVMVCDTITVTSKFEVKGANSIIQSLLGINAVNGKGNLVLKIDNIRLDMLLPFKIVKHDDDKLYLNFAEHTPQFEYKMKKVTVNMSDFKIANEDFSKLINDYFNQNWKTLMDNFGRDLVSTFVDIYLGVAHAFFASHPAEQFISEDLSYLLSKN